MAQDVTFTRSLALAGICSNDDVAQAILERFYSDILPRIHDRVECSTLQSRSIDRVFHAGSYPRLRRLAVLDARYAMIATILNDHPVAVLDRISHLTVVCDNQHIIEDNPEAPVRLFPIFPFNAAVELICNWISIVIGDVYHHSLLSCHRQSTGHPP